MAAWDPNRGTGDAVEFDMGNRWNMRSFWANDTLLAEDPPAKVSVANGQVDEARGMIRADVRVRDYRLVMQAARLLVFNPMFNDELSGGVWNEIQCAIAAKRPSFIYQDRSHDSTSQLAGLLGLNRASALGRPPGAEYLNIYNDLEQAMDAAFKQL